MAKTNSNPSKAKLVAKQSLLSLVEDENEEKEEKKEKTIAEEPAA